MDLGAGGPNPCMNTKWLDNSAAEAALAADLFTATPEKFGKYTKNIVLVPLGLVTLVSQTCWHGPKIDIQKTNLSTQKTNPSI